MTKEEIEVKVDEDINYLNIYLINKFDRSLGSILIEVVKFLLKKIYENKKD